MASDITRIVEVYTSLLLYFIFFIINRKNDLLNTRIYFIFNTKLNHKSNRNWIFAIYNTFSIIQGVVDIFTKK